VDQSLGHFIPACYPKCKVYGRLARANCPPLDGSGWRVCRRLGAEGLSRHRPCCRSANVRGGTLNPDAASPVVRIVGSGHLSPMVASRAKRSLCQRIGTSSAKSNMPAQVSTPPANAENKAWMADFPRHDASTTFSNVTRQHVAYSRQRAFIPAKESFLLGNIRPRCAVMRSDLVTGIGP
jgi:hypothetical protein